MDASTQPVTATNLVSLYWSMGVAVDRSGNVYIADTGDEAVKELSRAFVVNTTITELAAAGSAALPQVLPTTQALTGVFDPTSSDPSWLRIGASANGVVNFSFTANTGTSPRTAYITELGQQITVIQEGVPAVSVTAPTDKSYTDNKEPMLTATASDYSGGPGVAGVQFEYLINGIWQGAPGVFQTSGPDSGLYTFTFGSPLGDGTYQVYAVATDNAGNVGTSSKISFTVATNAPTVSLTANENFSNNSVPVVLTASATDKSGSGLATVLFQYSSDGGSSWSPPAATGPSTYTFGSLADGTYQARAIATDNAGNITTSAPVFFTVDTVAPTVTMTVPTNGSFTNNPTLTATAADNLGGSGLASVQFKYSSNGGSTWQNAGPAQTGGPFSFNLSSLGVSDGTYEAQAIATDNAGNTTTSAAVTFTLDTVAPTVSMTGPSNNSFTANNEPTLTATAADNTGGSGLASVQLQYISTSGGTWTNAGPVQTSGPFSFTFSSPLTSGGYDARAIATDNAGNTATSSAIFFTVDQVAPTVTMTGPTNNGYTNNPTLTASATDNPGGSGLASVQLEYSSNGGSSWQNAGPAQTTGPFNYNLSSLGVSNGTYRHRAVATDNVGNTATSNVVTFTLDTVAPTVTLTGPTDGTITSDNIVTLTATAADNPVGSGLANVQFQYLSNGTWQNTGPALIGGPAFTETTTALPDGIYKVRAVATDNAGNSTASNAASITVDTTAPTATMTAPTSGSFTNNNEPTLTATAADSGSGLASVQFQYSSNGGTTWQIAGAGQTSGPSSFSFTFGSHLLDGTYKVRAFATDNAGNTDTSSTVSFTVSTVGPTVAVTSPVNNSATGASTEAFTATATDHSGSGIASVEFQGSSDGGTTWQNVGAGQDIGGYYIFTSGFHLSDGT